MQMHNNLKILVRNKELCKHVDVEGVQFALVYEAITLIRSMFGVQQ